MSPTNFQRMPLAFLVLLVMAAGACETSGQNLAGSRDGTTRTSVPTPAAPTPSVTTKGEPREPVHLAALFRGVKGYRFRPGSPEVRKQAKSAVRNFVGRHLFAVQVVRAIKKEDRRRSPARPPVEATVLALSVSLPRDETVNGFQTKVVEALSQDTSSILTRVGGRPAYFSRDATPKHQSRVFFFYRGSVVVQVFGPPKVAKDVARRLLGRNR